jgi:membrane fusion protein (multidrug efflux system)
MKFDMKKRIIISTIVVLITVGALGGIKFMQIQSMTAYGKQFVPPPATVTVAETKRDAWEEQVTAVGSIEAVQGVMITAELPGKLVKIEFEPGTRVTAGTLLLQQDVTSEKAQLRAAETDVDLKKMNLDRSRQLLADNVIPQSQFDTAKAEYDQAVARRDDIQATIAKKTITAPFSGRLGIRLVSLGQNLRDNQEIVSLQSLDPIFANFLLPQQNLAKVREGMIVRVTNDVLQGKFVEGRITAINSEVDAATRNIRIQATVSNPEERLRPGMYVNAAVVMPSKLNVLAIPATSVLYAPYSDSVFVLEQKPSEQGQPPKSTVRQQFVSLGEQRGDYVAVLSGLENGDKVVSTGVFKLRNGQSVVVDNSLAPEFKLEPKPEDS